MLNITIVDRQVDMFEKGKNDNVLQNNKLVSIKNREKKDENYCTKYINKKKTNQESYTSEARFFLSLPRERGAHKKAMLFRPDFLLLDDDEDRDPSVVTLFLNLSIPSGGGGGFLFSSPAESDNMADAKLNDELIDAAGEGGVKVVEIAMGANMDPLDGLFAADALAAAVCP